MKQSVALIIAFAALVIGFGAGFTLRPVLAPSGPAATASGAAQPSEVEATAAVRRYRTGFSNFPNATLTLGECSPGTMAPGVTCMTRIVLDSTAKGAVPQNRPIGFARVGGQWEVSLW